MIPDYNLVINAKMSKSFFTSFTLSVLSVFLTIQIQGQYPPPDLPDTSDIGKYITRTMHLLGTSTPEKKNRVKILVYGQSVSEQDWWLEIKHYLEEEYPYADLIIENRAIGGFASQILYKTVRMDVESFYPDLVLFYVYGDNRYYDTIIYNIRRHTTAEIAIQTEHYTGENSWSDKMSYEYLLYYAEKYGCELIDIRTPWKKYLDDNNLKPSDLLRDDVHLNEYGNWLMAELIKPYLLYHPKFKHDPFGLVTDYVIGNNIAFVNDTLTLDFSGNRVDLIPEKTGHSPADSACIYLDGSRPSDFQSCYFYTRPYNDNGDSWPWSLGSMVRMQNQVPLVIEQWTLRYTDINQPYDCFSFEVSGSVTGFDGSGISTADFISNSRRVIIAGGEVDSGGDWHVKRSNSVTGTEVSTGDEVKWDIYRICNDKYVPAVSADTTYENPVTLFQTIPNTKHKLQIIRTGNGKVPVRLIRVYRPYWERP